MQRKSPLDIAPRRPNTQGMNSQQRVLTAFDFHRPDRIPCFDSFWEYPDAWRQRLGDPGELTDIAIWYPDETPFPTQVAELDRRDGYIYERDGWGRTVRRRENAFFVETLAAAIPAGADPAQLRFDPPELDSRYLTGKADPSVTFADAAAAGQALADDRRRHCVFGKTGGPYLRSTYLRGETQFLIDMAEDPGLARAIAAKMAEHLAAVGVEEIRRWGLRDGHLDLRRHGRQPRPDVWSAAIRTRAPARLSADDPRPTRRPAPLRRVALRRRRPPATGHAGGRRHRRPQPLGAAGGHGHRRRPWPLAPAGPGGRDVQYAYADPRPREEIEAEARAIIDLGRDGGVVIGTHSISPEIPLENYLIYRAVCLDYWPKGADHALGK